MSFVIFDNLLSKPRLKWDDTMLSGNAAFLMTDFWIVRSIESPTAPLYNRNSLGTCWHWSRYSLLKDNKIFGKIIISAKGGFVAEYEYLENRKTITKRTFLVGRRSNLKEHNFGLSLWGSTTLTLI